jgi:hypothetical protein
LSFIKAHIALSLTHNQIDPKTPRSEEPNTLSAVIRHKEILEIFVEVDQMDSEDRQIIAGVVKAFIMKNKMKHLLDNQKITA